MTVPTSSHITIEVRERYSRRNGHRCTHVTDYALLQVDTEARISGWNTGAERTFGYAEAEIVGQPMRKLYLPEDAARGDAERDLEIARDNGSFEDARVVGSQRR